MTIAFGKELYNSNKILTYLKRMDTKVKQGLDPSKGRIPNVILASMQMLVPIFTQIMLIIDIIQ